MNNIKAKYLDKRRKFYEVHYGAGQTKKFPLGAGADMLGFLQSISSCTVYTREVSQLRWLYEFNKPKFFGAMEELRYLEEQKPQRKVRWGYTLDYFDPDGKGYIGSLEIDKADRPTMGWAGRAEHTCMKAVRLMIGDTPHIVAKGTRVITTLSCYPIYK